MRAIREALVLAAAMVTVATGVSVIAAAPAAADTVRVNYGCAGWMGIGYRKRPQDVTITAPATASRGQTVTLTLGIVEPANQVAEPEPAGSWKIDLEVHLEGATSATHKARLASPELRQGDTWRLNGTLQVTLANAGTVTYRPGLWTLAGGGYVCYTGSPVPPPLASTVVR